MDQGKGAKKEMRMHPQFVDIGALGGLWRIKSCLNVSPIDVVSQVCHIVIFPELEAETATSPILVSRSGMFLHTSIFPFAFLYRSDH